MEVRPEAKRGTVLFGNIEASDIECLPEEQFAAKVRQALEEGTAGEGRGFVLMPSAWSAERWRCWSATLPVRCCNISSPVV